MTILGIALEQFRLHQAMHLLFDKKTTVITGLNASGKTSIIEAIQLLATGESFRAQKIDEMVAFGVEYGRVKGKLRTSDDEEKELEVLLTRGVVQGKKTPFRIFSVNGVRRQKRGAVGFLKTVVFRPEDMRLVEGSPARRRDFLNTPLSLLFSDYAAALQAYEQTLKRRNKLLETVRDHQQPRSVLTFWNQALIKHGSILQTERAEFFEFCKTVAFPYTFSAQYQPSVISQARQDEYLEREIIVGHSLIGPHKDDFTIQFADTRTGTVIDAAIYGSRGQQRLAVLWLKTAELSYIEHHTNELPVLLLDDIMSELDAESQGLVYQLLGTQQSIVTTIDPAVAATVSERLGQTEVQQVVLQES